MVGRRLKKGLRGRQLLIMAAGAAAAVVLNKSLGRRESRHSAIDEAVEQDAETQDFKEEMRRKRASSKGSETEMSPNRSSDVSPKRFSDASPGVGRAGLIGREGSTIRNLL